MPLKFSLIPEHLAISVVQKLDLRVFINFHQCSINSYEISKKVKTRFLFEVPGKTSADVTDEGLLFIVDPPESPDEVELLASCVVNSSVRIVIDRFEFRGDVSVCELLTEFLLSTNSTIYQFDLSPSYIAFESDPDRFNALLKASKAPELLLLNEALPSEYFRVPAMKQIEFVSSYVCPLSDENLSALRVPFMKLERPDITNYGINSLLKEWLDGQREIWSVAIESSGLNFKKSVIFDGIRYTVTKCQQCVMRRGSAYSSRRAFVIRRGDGKKIAVRLIPLHIAIEDVNNEMFITF